jgi:hypothetical protein
MGMSLALLFRDKFLKPATFVCLLLGNALCSSEAIAQQDQPYQYLAISKAGKALYFRQGDVIQYRLYDDNETYSGVFEKYIGNAILISGAVISKSELKQINIPKDNRLTRLAHSLGGTALVAAPMFFAMDVVNPIFRGDNMHVSRQNIQISSIIAGTGAALLVIPDKNRYRINKPWKLELIESTRVLPRKSRIKLIL